MRLIDVTATRSPCDESIMLHFRVGALRLTAVLDVPTQWAMIRLLTGATADAVLPMHEDSINLQLPRGVRELTCDTLNVRKGGL